MDAANGPNNKEFMSRSLRLAAALVALILLPLAPVRAQLTIDIVGGSGTAVPIAIVPFDGEPAGPTGISGVVGADLARSGLFKLVDPSGMPRASRIEDVQAAAWRAKGADAVVVGSARPLADGRVLTVVDKLNPTPAAYPRRPGQPAKSPLGSRTVR
jgi:TolB protein